MTAVLQAVIHRLFAVPDDPACRSRYIHLTIHPDVPALRTAARRYRNDSDHSSAVGMFQPAPFRSRYDRHTRRWVDSSGAFAGVMRLAVGHLSGEVVAHESTHAALHVWRLHRWSTTTDSAGVDLGDYCGDAEEAFAYLLGGIAGEVANVVARLTQ